MAPQVTPVWENLFYGIINRIPLKQGFKRVKTFDIGGKIIAGQIENSKTLHNGNLQKRITTVYPNGHLGMETRIYSPSGELLKSYAGIRTSYGTKEYYSGNAKLVPSVVTNMHESEKLANAKTLENI